MNIGMMWFDNRKNATVADRALEAAEYFVKKYGAIPNVIVINIKESPSLQEVGAGDFLFEIKHARSILPHHLWMGVKEAGV